MPPYSSHLPAAPCRFAIHVSLLALYGLGGYLVSSGLMPLRTLLSAVGFTFSLVFSSQGVVQSLTDGRRALAAIARSAPMWPSSHKTLHNHWLGL